MTKLDASRTGSPLARTARETLQELAVKHGDLPAGQVGAEAVVGAGATEAEVGIGSAAHVEALRVVEDGFVAVTRGVVQQHPIALVQLLPAQLCRFGEHRAAHPDHRAGPAHDLLHRARREPLEVAEPERTSDPDCR